MTRAATAIKPSRMLRQLEHERGHEARRRIRDDLRGRGVAAVPALVAGLGDASALVRWEAVNLLGDLAPPAASVTVVEFALTEDDHHARWRAFWAASRFDRALVVTRLRSELRGSDPVRRRRAALLLSTLGIADGGSVIVAGLSSASTWERWESLSAIRALGLAGCEAAVSWCLDRREPAHVRREATLALGTIGSPAALRRLRPLLDDADPQVRWRAAMALAGAGPTVVPALRARLAVEIDSAVCSQLVADISRLEAQP